MAVGDKATHGSAAADDDHRMQLVGYANFKVSSKPIGGLDYTLGLVGERSRGQQGSGEAHGQGGAWRVDPRGAWPTSLRLLRNPPAPFAHPHTPPPIHPHHLTHPPTPRSATTPAPTASPCTSSTTWSSGAATPPPPAAGGAL